jgi:exodeoxyribonuclease VII small subunit
MAEKNEFQKKLDRLNVIVDEISNKSLPLDESLKLYEEGNEIIKELEKTLKEAEEKVENLVVVK